VSIAVLPVAFLALSGCAGDSSATTTVTHSSEPRVVATSNSSSTPSARATSSSAAVLGEWPEFGLNAQRSDATNSPTGITAKNLNDLRAQTVALPGTVDSSPIYLHDVSVNATRQDVIVVTTTYGRTVAIDPSSGRLLWVFTPPGYASWAGTAQITNSSPIVDPDHLCVYAASPNGLIHKLSLSSGREDTTGAWPVSVTHDPKHEKLGSALARCFAAVRTRPARE
jgi:outer membrane protein assembly factor BamB